MSRVILVCVLLLAAVSSAVESESPPIPIVKTLADLRAVSPVKLADGAEVRIGITESAADGSPWRLVYCLPVDPKMPLVNPDGDPEEWLGPVNVRVVRDKQVNEVTGSIQASEFQRHEGQPFFCTAVPVFNEGAFHVEVFQKTAPGKETVIFRSKVEVKKDTICDWHRFAERTGDTHSLLAVTTAMRPRYSGMVEHSWPADAKGDIALDGFDAEHPLELLLDQSVADPVLSVKCAVDMIDSPGEHLLARWWVNRKPIAAAPAKAADIKMQQHGWKISFSKEMKLTFALPRTLGPLKAGDRVTLQVMYSPAGSKPLFEKAGLEPRQQMPQVFVPRIVGHPATLPRLSDKLEITVTGDMLPK